MTSDLLFGGRLLQRVTTMKVITREPALRINSLTWQSLFRFRIAHRAALLLGSDPADRQSLLRFLRRIYDARSGLVHEGKSPFATKDNKSLTSDDLQRLADLVREAILRLSVLFAREKPSRDEALIKIEDCAYDPASLAVLQQKTDIETFLREQGL
jgi:hypothetical protein